MSAPTKSFFEKENMPTQDLVEIKYIKVTNRLRSDLGDIDDLANSIREYGIIQPIVLAVNRDGTTVLIAGGRRLEALKRLGIVELLHAVHFIWNTEIDPIKQKGMELEENLKRKDLSWQEQVTGKQQLLELMQSIHGVPSGGRPKIGTDGGFGVNKLAAMLGESAANTTKDLQIAEAIKTIPSLGRAENKGSVLTKLKIFSAIASMSQLGAKNAQQPAKTTRLWELHEQDFRTNNLPDNSVDLVWTDLPYGTDIDTMSKHFAGVELATFDDSKLSVLDMLEKIAKESYRVLKNDRFACFCFGFTTYTDLVLELTRAGFNVNPVPVVWFKNTKSSENPTIKYSNSYEPILVASKGSPVFIRPGQSNVVTIPTEQNKLQAVQKPVELVIRFLQDTVTPGATVVDWCAGTGTTGVACSKLGIRSILYEKEPSMIMLAKTRLEAL